MAALPQGAFAACKLREQYQERDLLMQRMKSSGSGDAKSSPQNKKSLEYTPVKYNGKLMNSIWGFYNRYSPHNIKSNDYETPKEDGYGQQHQAVASLAQSWAMAFGAGKK